jgi:hypothetical protein
MRVRCVRTGGLTITPTGRHRLEAVARDRYGAQKHVWQRDSTAPASATIFLASLTASAPKAPRFRRETGIGTSIQAPMSIDPDLLRGFSVFSALHAAERQTLSDAASLRRLCANDAVFVHGQPATELCLVLSGRIKLSKAGWARDPVIVRIGHPGEFLELGRTLRPGGYDLTSTLCAVPSLRFGLHWSGGALLSRFRLLCPT